MSFMQKWLHSYYAWYHPKVNWFAVSSACLHHHSVLKDADMPWKTVCLHSNMASTNHDCTFYGIWVMQWIIFEWSYRQTIYQAGSLQPLGYNMQGCVQLRLRCSVEVPSSFDLCGSVCATAVIISVHTIQLSFPYGLTTHGTCWHL